MSVLELSWWQFGITTVYHFLFVPITIGLAFLVAGFETAWLRSGDDRWSGWTPRAAARQAERSDKRQQRHGPWSLPAR